MRFLRASSIRLWAAMLVVVSCACAPGSGSAARDASTASGASSRNIDHLVPVRDFTGPPPTIFQWTPVEGADSYILGVWNEADRRVVHRTGVTGPSLAVTPDVDFEPGTYFWSVVAVRGGRTMAESGFSAFVVRH